MTRTMTLAQAAAAQAEYEAARAAGQTFQACDICDQPVAERDANWDFYAGTGTVLHQVPCTRLYIIGEAAGWLELAYADYLEQVEDIFFMRSEGKAPTMVSYRELRAKNAREHPDDEFYTRKMDPSQWPDYMDMALYCMGVPTFHLGFPEHV